MDIESQSGDAIATIESSPFNVHLDNFDGPFDLLLQLISRHKLDITEVSLSLVTDEFIAYIRALELSGEGWKLDQATEFLVVAATLLDLKAARDWLADRNQALEAEVSRRMAENVFVQNVTIRSLGHACKALQRALCGGISRCCDQCSKSL